MSARILDGTIIGKAIRDEVAVEVARMKGSGRRPGLAAVLVGEDPASAVYVRSKGKACEEAGMHSVTVRLPPDTPEAELLATVDRLNADPEIHGILVQLPLPKHINSEKVLRRIDPAKDVDGFHPMNVGKLVTGDKTAFRPATPYGVQQMLIRSGIETKGAHAVIVGRSNIVGRPMANLLIQQGPGGMHSVTVRLPPDTPEAELLATVDRLNADPEIHGILVQLPLPKHINSEKVLRRIDPAKDVDGFHPMNVGKLVTGDKTAFRPATPYGVQQMLIRSGIDTKGAHAVIVGRSNIVGRPLANLLIQQGPGGDATVTVCHSRTRDLPAVTRSADILIAAIGKAEFVTADMVRPGAVVIDVGINRVDDASRPKGYRLVGDVAYEQVAQIASAITPVPGGVGPMTIAMLLQNTLQAMQQAELD